MDHSTSRVPPGRLDRTHSAPEHQPDFSAGEAGPDLPKSTTFTTADDMTKSPSKEDSSWRRRLPKRGFTMLPNARVEPRPFVNNYFFKRPRLLQYWDHGALVDSHGRRLEPANTEDFLLSNVPTEGDASTPSVRTAAQDHHVEDSADAERSKIQRDWLNLLIDLVWVGIVSNISAGFVSTAFEPSSVWGYAFLEFIVLFLTAFRFWSYIRKFLNNYFRKDFLQSLFLTWVLVLALFFGNQTPYFLDPVGGRWIIGTFLVAKASFVAVELIYCIYIPALRREVLMTFIISVPVSTLWASSISVSWPTQAALMLPAVLGEGIVSAIIALPLGDWFLRGAPKKALDPENFVDRLQGFFIIVLGEGVFGLISGNDWGAGLNTRVVWAIEALMIYSAVFWLFFTGDQTKTYIHAIYRNRYTSVAFQALHVLLFASILLFDASIKYLIQKSPTSSSGPEATLDPERARSLLLARWTIVASLDATLIWITLKALLNRSLDTPGTLLVDSRYLRMVPRAVVCVIVMCLPAVKDIGTYTFLSVILAMLQSLILFELVAAMEKGAKLFEPKDS